MVNYSDINKEIIDLWKEFPNECGNRIPLLFPPSEDGCILFISFNPSFPPALANQNWEHPYDIERLFNINADQVIKQEIKTHNSLPYFKPLKDIAGDLNLPCSHLDIFMLRETKQETATNVCGNENQLTPFGRRQFDLFIHALQKSSPKVTVVINASASRIIKAQLNLSYKSSDGCYYSSDEKINAPFFLAGMLSGQHAMDTFSRERLVWHIKKILNRTF